MHLTQRVVEDSAGTHSVSVLEHAGCIPLDRIDYIPLNGPDCSTITVFKCQKKKKGEREKEDVTEGHKLCWILTDCSLAVQER